MPISPIELGLDGITIGGIPEKMIFSAVSEDERAIFASLPLITTSINTNSMYTFKISPSMESASSLGYKRDEWLVNPYWFWLTHLHKEDSEKVLAEYNYIPKPNENRIIEYRMIAKDGKPRWIRESTQLTESQVLQTTLQDITQEKNHAEKLNTLRRTAELFSSRLPLDEIMDNLRREIKHIVPYRTANVMLVENDPDGNSMIKIAYTWGYNEEKVPPPEIKSIPLKIYPTLEKIYKNPNYMIINDTSKDSMWQSDGETRRWVKSWLGVPIRYKGKVIGFINCNSPETDTYTEGDARFLQAMADQIGIAVENATKDTQLELQRKKLEVMSFTDELTGLPNTRAWYNAIEKEEARFSHTKRPYSVFVIDCNRFKYINDNFTHPVGDTVLKTIAQFLQQTIRRQNFDFVARPNDQGDEFYILLPETDNDGANKVEEYIFGQTYEQLPTLLLAAIRQNHPVRAVEFEKFINSFVEKKLPLISIGYATKEQHLTSLNMLEIADIAMNYSKQSFNLTRDS